MTSNLRDPEEVKERFRPEFINRIDEIITFKSLGMEEIKKIIDIQMNGLKKRLEERKITLGLSDKAKEFLAKTGFDPVYGARPLKRVIQKYIQDPLALKVLSSEIKDGDSLKAALQNEGKSKGGLDNEIIFVKIWVCLTAVKF